MASPKGIKILATSDIHGLLDGLDEIVTTQNPHVLVIAGDINPARIDVDADQWFRGAFFPLVSSWASRSVRVVACPGNHDFWLNKYLCGEIKCELPPNFHLLCDSEETVYGLRFYGTPWVPYISGHWCWEASEDTLRYQFSKIPQGVDVLITHSPPLIKHATIDISTEKPKDYWRHFGSKSLTEIVRQKRPKMLFCGHIHSGTHNTVVLPDQQGNPICDCFNVSRVNEKYQVYYAPVKIELPFKD